MTGYVKLFEQWNAENETARIAFVGDIMQHERQLEFEKSRNFTYDGVFDGIAPTFNSCDLVIGNLETTIGNHESGFPDFNAPYQLLDALKVAGFDVLITANNHSLDSGEEGLKKTYRSIERTGMVPIGTMGTTYRTFNLNGTPVTIHAYTTFVNDGRTSDLLSIWDGVAEKQKGVNIAYVHAGKEYSNDVMPEQTEIINSLKREGFDGVIFTHSHIPGPVHKDDDFFVVFGMGNFISDQFKIKGPEHGNCIIIELLHGKINKIETMRTVSVVQDDGETNVSISE